VKLQRVERKSAPEALSEFEFQMSGVYVGLEWTVDFDRAAVAPIQLSFATSDIVQ
jgi:hypothetical protein